MVPGIRNGTVIKLKVYFFCREKWEKKNVTFHDNDTVTFHQEKIYHFDESLSAGSEDDVVVVPNIPMLVSFVLLFFYGNDNNIFVIFRAPLHNLNTQPGS